MAIASGTPVPATFILPEDHSINAFAAGLTTHDAVVAVTQGTLDALNRDELQAVIGHEFSHILNGDMRLNFRIASILFGILVIGLTGRAMFSPFGRVRMSTRGGGGKKGGGGNLVLVYFAIAGALIAIGYIGYFFGRLVQAAVSRQREFLADASAVQFTRNPVGLTGALRKIGGQATSPELHSPKAAQINHCFFAQAFVAGFGGNFATHPPLPERIRAIDPNFDGNYIPPEPKKRETPAPAARGKVQAPPPLPPPLGAILPDRLLDPAALLATVGVLSTEGIDYAQQLLADLGDDLREAARDPRTAEPLIYALMLDQDPVARRRQMTLLDSNSQAATREFHNLIEPHPIDVRLPLAQLAIGALRKLDAAGQAHVKSTLKQLAESDGEISPLEYALQRVVGHGMDAARAPGRHSLDRIYSFGAISRPASVFLSALAQAGTSHEKDAQAAFEGARPQLPLLSETELKFTPPDQIDLEKLDGALDRLALAAPPIKQRVVAAACAIMAKDGVVKSREIELLRAACAALDVPMPPVPPPSA
jgi:Zn-dependent protease with chaperone function